MGAYLSPVLIIRENHMNSIKYLFYTSLLTISCNAFGMFGFEHELTSNKPSKQREYECLGLLHLTGKKQSQYFDYLNNNDTNNPEFQTLLKKAQLQQFKESEKENPVITNLKNSEYIFTNSYRLTKLASEPKKLNIKISKDGRPTKVLSERNK